MNNATETQGERGQSLMEIVFAIAIFTIGVVTIGYLMFDSFIATGRAHEYTTARLLAREGITIVAGMNKTAFDTLTSGSYGLIQEPTGWSFSPEPSQHGIFERTITISDIDTDRKEVEVEVSWVDRGMVPHDVRFVTHGANWTQQGGDRAFLVPRTEYVSLQASSTELSGLEVSNEHSEMITITEMSLVWSGPANLIGIVFEGILIADGSVTPYESGEPIDITDSTLNAYSGFRTLESITFSDALQGDVVHITFTLADGSTRYLTVTL